MVEKKQAEVTFEYTVSPNYGVYAVNGIHGGFNAQGDLVANFFYERSPIPKKITHAINDDDSLGDELSRETSDAIVRQITFGISMNPRIARYFAKWFNNKADEYERAFGRHQGDNDHK